MRMMVYVDSIEVGNNPVFLTLNEVSSVWLPDYPSSRQFAYRPSAAIPSYTNVI
jgi:hypothetical protein